MNLYIIVIITITYTIQLIQYNLYNATYTIIT